MASKPVMKLNSTILPDYAEFEEETEDMVAKNRALSGKLNVDVFANIKNYKVKFPILETSEFNIMEAIFKTQKATGNMVRFEVISDDVNIDIYGYMSAPKRRIKWGATVAEGFEFTIEGRDADS